MAELDNNVSGAPMETDSDGRMSTRRVCKRSMILIITIAMPRLYHQLSHVYSSKPDVQSMRVSLTVDKSDDLADRAANLAEGSGSVGDGRASSSGGLGKTLGGLGGSRRGSLAGLVGGLRGGRGVSNDGSPGQELRLPQNGTGGSGHFGDCGRGRRSEDEYPSTGHPLQSLV